jgi:UMF1 family MFS transporter
LEKKKLGIDTSKLIIIILLINVVAILERICFRDYQKIGNINTLKITIVIWGFICVAAYLLDAKSKSIDIFMLWEPR